MEYVERVNFVLIEVNTTIQWWVYWVRIRVNLGGLTVLKLFIQYKCSFIFALLKECFLHLHLAPLNFYIILVLRCLFAFTDFEFLFQ